MLKDVLARLNQLQEEMETIKSDLIGTISESFDFKTLGLEQYIEGDEGAGHSKSPMNKLKSADDVISALYKALETAPSSDKRVLEKYISTLTGVTGEEDEPDLDDLDLEEDDEEEKPEEDLEPEADVDVVEPEGDEEPVEKTSDEGGDVEDDEQLPMDDTESSDEPEEQPDEDDIIDEDKESSTTFEELKIGGKFTFGEGSGVDGEFVKVSPTEYKDDAGKKFAVINPSGIIFQVPDEELTPDEAPEEPAEDEGGDADSEAPIDDEDGDEESTPDEAPEEPAEDEGGEEPEEDDDEDDEDVKEESKKFKGKVLKESKTSTKKKSTNKKKPLNEDLNDLVGNMIKEVMNSK